MKEFPIEKYRFYTNGKKVIAVSTYCGKVIRGTASCNPKDKFDLEKGKMLAAARCNERVARKRERMATNRMYEARDAVANAMEYLNTMNDYKVDATNARMAAETKLAELLEDM